MDQNIKCKQRRIDFVCFMFEMRWFLRSSMENGVAKILSVVFYPRINLIPRFELNHNSCMAIYVPASKDYL